MPVPLVTASHATLIENQRLRRNRSDTDDAESAGRNFDQLRIGQVDQCRVVSHLGEVTAFSRLLRTVLLVHRQPRKANHMVVFCREVNGFAKRDATSRRWFGLLCERRTWSGDKQQPEDRGSNRHDCSPVRG